MPAKSSPYVEAKYGWNYGEDGWSNGMDENMLKFSFLFDRNIDGIVESLPPVVNGKAYFMSTDNRLYFGANNSWYSSPIPNWFTVTLRATGQFFQFTGSSMQEVLSNSGAEDQLESIQLVLDSLGTASTKDTSFFASSTDLSNGLDQKANIISPTFIGTVSGITKSMVGLSNVDNTADLNKPISTATQTALTAAQQNIVNAMNSIGVVKMVRTGNNIWTVFTPEGAIVDTTGSSTSGLQEAINYAVNNSRGLHVVGGGTTAIVSGNPNSGDVSVINCSTGIVFPPMQGKTIRFDWCTINFGGAVTGPGLLIDSCMMVNFEFNGQVVYIGNEAAVVFKPTNNVPLDGVKSIIDSQFRIHTIACVGGVNPVGVRWDATLGPILGCPFDFIEVNGANLSTVYGLHGLQILDAAAGGGFISNIISCPHLHKFKGVSLQVGSTAGTAIYSNKFKVNCFPTPESGFTATAVQCYAKDNFFEVNVLSDEGLPAEGIKLESNAYPNDWLIGRNDATVKINDQSTVKSNFGLYRKRYSAVALTTSQTGITTNTYTKVNFNSLEVTNGGWDATNFRWIPAAVGLCQVSTRASWVATNDQAPLYIAVYKNGALYREVLGVASGTSGGQGPSANFLVYSGSVTDYFEIFVKQISGANQALVGANVNTYATFSYNG